MGLRLRLILVLIIPLVLVVGVYGLVRIRHEQAQLLDEDRRNMAPTAKALQIAVENALRDRQISDIKRLLSEIVEYQEQIDRIRLFDRKLSPTLVSNPLSIGEEVPVEAVRRVIETGQPEGFYQRRGRQPVLFYLVPLRARKGEIQGAMEVVHLASGVEQKVQAATRDVWLRLGVLLLVVTVLTGLVLQRQVLRPLSRLMAGIRSLGLGQPGPPLPVERRDELGRVAEAFNQMAEQLEAARLKLLAETDRTLELEHQLRQAETLAVAGKLATGLAHEVGTPLNIISGRAEFLLQTLSPGDTRRPDLEVIVAQIDRISGIIRSLLDTVRPQKPEVQPTALAPLLDRLLPLLQHGAKRRGVALAAAVPADLPPMLADPNQLQQVLINLLMNALEATPAGGRVEVRAGRSIHEGRAGVAVSVRDTGPGIPPDLLPRVFDPFFTTKPPGQGTGLGLAICRDIVREHAGEIQVESRSDRGATFTVWLPEAEGHRS
ncbi:MAG: HAMP domain-containing protein [Candidatus Rokubacteria bacterium]|nr:HAMP domain-containing protein [Candidatus Rokubacteria bacterium]